MVNTVDRKSNNESSAGRHWMVSAVRSFLELVGRVSPRLAGRLVFSMMIRPRRRQAKLTERTSIPESLRIWDNGRNLQAYRWSGSRRVLLVHGWDSSSADFSALIPRLARAGWGGLAYDGPAHGRSDGTNTDFLKLGATFRRMVGEHGPFDAIISHSLGSAIVLDQLAQNDARIPGSIVVGSAPASLDQVFNYYFDQLGLAPEVVENLNWRIARRLGRSADEISMADAIEDLDTEILIVHDREDKYFAINSARRLRNAAREASLIETEGLGHRGWLKDERTLTAIADFLNRSHSAASST